MQHVKEVTSHKNNGTINASHRKEDHFFRALLFLAPAAENSGRLVDTVAEVRLYTRDGSTVYACLWLRIPGVENVGMSGKAGGYGYHKASAALSSALTMGGYKMAEEVSAVGEEAMIEAVKAVLCFHGVEQTQVISAHG